MNTEMQRRLLMLLVRALLVCMLGASGFAAAATITEVEPNDSISSAQSTPVPSEGLTISAVVGELDGLDTTDADFFAFDATEGDTPSITIVSAMIDASGACSLFMNYIALYDALGKLLGQSLTNCPVADASINGVTLPATGRYFVAISGYPHFWDEGGVSPYMSYPTVSGPYQLIISGVRDPNAAPVPAPPAPTPAPSPSPAAKQVPIRVEHWHQDENGLEKRNGQDPIVVGILSMNGFDAMTVVPESLTFGRTGEEKSLFRCRKGGKDMNRDGRIDMVCYFKPDVAGFQTNDLNGLLRGKTKSGEQIEATGALKIFKVTTERRRAKGGKQGNDDNKSKK
ncbi:MAG TPA: hypothetical protein VF934_04950 [Burkholderiales bacterium]